MKRGYKITAWVIGGIILLCASVIGVFLLKNVNEWTISGSDPLFIVAEGSYDTEKRKCNDELREFDHCNVKTGSLGLRLVMYPESLKK